MELTANEAQAYLVGGQLKRERGKGRCIKYKDRQISRTYILDNTNNVKDITYRPLSVRYCQIWKNTQRVRHCQIEIHL